MINHRWSREKRGVLAVAGKPDLEVASPPEFRGHPGIWTRKTCWWPLSRIVLRPRMVVSRPEDRDAVLAAFREAKSGCLIAKSILAKVEAEPEVVVQA